MECSNNKLLDHLIGAGKQRGRHVQSDRFRGFEVDDPARTSSVVP
jgi:hypothetical protein